MFFSITKHAKYPDEAAKFINWFTNDLEANKILMAERGVPISPKIQEALAPLLGKPQKAMFDFLKKIEAESSPICPPDPAGAGDVDTNVYVPEVIDPVMFKSITPEEAAVIFREKANEILTAAQE
jgi:multiple sugar transport system substrate-binding protein